MNTIDPTADGPFIPASAWAAATAPHTVATSQAEADIAALRAAGLDFEPRCEPCRVMRHIEIPVARAFTCSTCDRIQLRCLNCADHFHENPHAFLLCAGCRIGGCFHMCFTIGPIGGTK